jgi:FkbM family methyltransferase
MIKAILKAVLRKAGYIVFKNGFLPIGTSLVHDIQRFNDQNKITTVLDVGANVGRFSRTMAEAFPKAMIYAFEPVPKTFSKLQAACKLYSNIHCFNVALSSMQGSAIINVLNCDEMSSMEVNPLLAKYYSKNEIMPASHVRVEQDTVDHFAAGLNINMIDLLKIDTEGHDMHVLHGAAALLEKKAIKFILVEFYKPAKSNHPGSGFLDELAVHLENFGYQFTTSYTEWVDPNRQFFGVHNALFALVK